MNEDLAVDVESARFTAVRLRMGYDMGDVDRFLDALAQRLRSGEGIATFIGQARFTPVKRREGYDMAQVDRFLDDIVRRAEVAPSQTAPATSSAPGPDLQAEQPPAAYDSGHGLNADLIAKLRTTAFPGSGLRPGYAKRNVDAILGRLEERLAAGRTFDDLLAAPRGRERFGYDVAAVDALLDEVRYAARYA